MSEADTIREALAAQLHDVYQAEARWQGDVRHHDDYVELPERIKAFDRALADFILERETALERRAEQAEAALRETMDWIRMFGGVDGCNAVSAVETSRHLSECPLFKYRAATTPGGPFCMANNDGFLCNLSRGHEGDHQELHPSGGRVGWSATPGEPR